MEPKYVTESRPICVTETRNETRYRTKMVYKTVPVTETKYRSKTVNVPHTETKTINYSVLVPVKSEKTVELTESVPVWTEVPEEYTVRVPHLGRRSRNVHGQGAAASGSIVHLFRERSASGH